MIESNLSRGDSSRVAAFQSDKRRIIIESNNNALVVKRKRCFSPSSSFRSHPKERISSSVKPTTHKKGERQRGVRKATTRKKKEKERPRLSSSYHSCELAYFKPSMTVEYARCPKPTLLESAGAKAKELGLESAVEDANRFKECLSAIFVFRVFFF